MTAAPRLARFRFTGTVTDDERAFYERYGFLVYQGVFSARDLPLAEPDPSDRNRSPLAIDRVVFNGHPVVAVVAESEALAEDAIQVHGGPIYRRAECVLD